MGRCQARAWAHGWAQLSRDHGWAGQGCGTSAAVASLGQGAEIRSWDMAGVKVDPRAQGWGQSGL